MLNIIFWVRCNPESKYFLKKNIRNRIIKVQTLKKKKDFDDLFKKGIYSSCNYYKLIAFPNEEKEQTVRFGFVVNKKFGKAVKRNRIKRQLKEIFRNIEKDAISNMDFLIIVKNSMGDLEFTEIKTAVMNSMNRFMR